MSATTDFAAQLLGWYDRHGRNDLPWQHPRTPYRVWVAEIMLQQTQVTAVIGYFERFMARFPDVHSLAAADADTVMAHWAGLGYYARARNLHAAARVIVDDHGGELPAELEALMALPGIGRSTAGAILAQAFGLRAPILDGNAKRVLARMEAVDGAPGQAAFEKALWHLAEQYTPHERLADYTQAIMDLGATVCLKRAPKCAECPVSDDCRALAQGRQAAIPAPRRRAKRPLRTTQMLILRRSNRDILFERRPPAGIWGGLWALPEVPVDQAAETYCRRHFGVEPAPIQQLPSLHHGFTHFELEIKPVEMQITGYAGIMDEHGRGWYAPADPPPLPAPIAKLIRNLGDQTP